MTPVTEIENLKDGVYEKVMSRRFAEVLKEALAEDQVRAEEEDVDAEEAVGYLSSYLQRVIRLCLKDIADRDEENSVDHQLALTNELIASLAKKTEELGGGQEVANAPFLLRSLEHKKNTLLPRQWERPATSLTRSFLFTNSKKDVSMVHELTKEIASSDRIDFLISFIRFHPFLRPSAASPRTAPFHSPRRTPARRNDDIHGSDGSEGDRGACVSAPYRSTHFL